MIRAAEGKSGVALAGVIDKRGIAASAGLRPRRRRGGGHERDCRGERDQRGGRHHRRERELRALRGSRATRLLELRGGVFCLYYTDPNFVDREVTMICRFIRYQVVFRR